MKKLFALSLIIFALASCTKTEDEVIPTKPADTKHFAAFTGTETGQCYINGKAVEFGVIYDIKIGDKLSLIDNGSDTSIEAVYLYPTNGGSPIEISPSSYTEGYTAGSIIVDYKTVKESTIAQTNINIVYTVK